MKKSETLKEIWVDVVGWEGLYMVSNLGRIRSPAKLVYRGARYGYYLRNPRIISPAKNDFGHLYVGLHRKGKQITISIHRIVLEAFVGLCPEGMECCHFPDRNPENNRIDNLQWGTKKEQYQHRIIHGTSIPPTETISIVCGYCGESFIEPHWSDKKFCSSLCWKKYQSEEEIREGYYKSGCWMMVCKQCHKEKIFKYRCHAERRKYCSLTCRDVSRRRLCV